jgi:phosphoribosyl 1,2-cyclic phosphodiesterase
MPEDDVIRERGNGERFMVMRVCVLASGSSGNCTYVGSETTAILIDAGLSGRDTADRLGRIGVDVAAIRAVCVSHEHNDHTAGLRVLHRRHRIPVYANSDTIGALRRGEELAELKWHEFENGQTFGIGDLTIAPFSVPHDAMNPVGFVIRCGDVRAAIVTDIGMPTTLVRECLKGCQVIVVEANHDERLLQDSRRPWHLKQRIAGRQGHLSNETAAELVAEIAGAELEHIFLAHLSAECNRRDLALKTVERKLKHHGHERIKVSLTYPDEISEVWTR